MFFGGSNGSEEVVIEGEGGLSLFTMMLMITMMTCRVPTYWRIVLGLVKSGEGRRVGVRFCFDIS